MNPRLVFLNVHFWIFLHVLALKPCTFFKLCVFSKQENVFLSVLICTKLKKYRFPWIQKCSAHKSGSSLCGMRSDGNPARLWPATQRHFLCPWGSGLPARAISFMENSGLFSGFIKIDEKTNKTHGFEHFTCNPLRDPHFRKFVWNFVQLIPVRKQSFRQSAKETCRHDRIQGSFERFPKTSCNPSNFFHVWTQ